MHRLYVGKMIWTMDGFCQETVLRQKTIAFPAAAAPILIEYTLTGDDQFFSGTFSQPFTPNFGPIDSGSLTVTLYAAGCSTPPGPLLRAGDSQSGKRFAQLVIVCIHIVLDVWLCGNVEQPLLETA